MTFTVQETITALVVILAFGLVAGAVAWDHLVTDRVRRQLDVAEARRRATLIRAETASIRASAYALMLRTHSVLGHRVLDDGHNGSRKAPEPASLTVVK